jgi:hypothetical protein
LTVELDFTDGWGVLEASSLPAEEVSFLVVEVFGVSLGLRARGALVAGLVVAAMGMVIELEVAITLLIEELLDEVL